MYVGLQKPQTPWYKRAPAPPLVNRKEIKKSTGRFRVAIYFIFFWFPLNRDSAALVLRFSFYSAQLFF